MFGGLALGFAFIALSAAAAICTARSVMQETQRWQSRWRETAEFLMLRLTEPAQAQQEIFCAVAGLGVYPLSLPENAHILRVAWLHQTMLYVLMFVNEQDFFRLAQPDGLTVTGTPMYACYLERQLHLWPVPDNTYEIQIQYSLAEEVRHRENQYEQLVIFRSWQFPFRSAEADARSIELLKTWLTPRQRDQYEAEGVFEVVGDYSLDTYRLSAPAPYNILNLATKQKWCVVPEGVYCPGDILLAQKIALETDEKHTLSVANKYIGSVLDIAQT